MPLKQPAQDSGGEIDPLNKTAIHSLSQTVLRGRGGITEAAEQLDRLAGNSPEKLEKSMALLLNASAKARKGLADLGTDETPEDIAAKVVTQMVKNAGTDRLDDHLQALSSVTSDSLTEEGRRLDRSDTMDKAYAGAAVIMETQSRGIDPKSESLIAKFTGFLSQNDDAGIEGTAEMLKFMLGQHPDSAPQLMAVLVNSVAAAKHYLAKRSGTKPEELATQVAVSLVRRMGEARLFDVVNGLNGVRPQMLRPDAQSIDPSNISERLENAAGAGAFDKKSFAPKGELAFVGGRALLEGPKAAGEFGARRMIGDGRPVEDAPSQMAAVGDDLAVPLETAGLPGAVTAYAFKLKPDASAPLDAEAAIGFVRTAIEHNVLPQLVEMLARAAPPLHQTFGLGKNPEDALKLAVEPALARPELAKPLTAALIGGPPLAQQVAQALAKSQTAQDRQQTEAKSGKIKKLLRDGVEEVPENFVDRALAVNPGFLARNKTNIGLMRSAAVFIITGDPDAKPEEVKDSKRGLSLGYHPDKVQGAERKAAADKITKLVDLCYTLATEGTNWNTFADDLEKAAKEMKRLKPEFKEPAGMAAQTEGPAPRPSTPNEPEAIKAANALMDRASAEPPEKAVETVKQIVGLLLADNLELRRQLDESTKKFEKRLAESTQAMNRLMRKLGIEET